MSYVRDRRETLAVCEAVASERDRQERLRIAGKFKQTCADSEMDAGIKLAVLIEEVGEVGRAMLGDGDLRAELIQVAAVAVAWAESLASTSSDLGSLPDSAPVSRRAAQPGGKT